MRKNLWISMMAASMVLATSCTNEDLINPNEGDQVQVTFSVGMPEMETRAFSDGLTAKQLKYAVYEVEDEQLSHLIKLDGETTINLTANVPLQLTTGKTYAVIFWAAAENAPYKVDFENKTMTVDYTNAVSNDEKRDAFYKYHEFTVTGSQTENVELRRPFAQLNIGTNDYTASANAGYTPKYSYVKVPAYSTLDLVNGTASEEAVREFKLADIPENETFPVDGYEYLAMNYLLVPADNQTVDVTFGYSENENTVDRDRTVGSVPVQRNHRTNIYGQLLTSNVDVNVEINPEYEDPAYGGAESLLYAAANGGAITLTEDVVLTSQLEVKAALVLNMNGHKISAAFAKGSGAVINNTSTLKIIGGTLENTTTNGDAVINNSGNLILEGTKINGAPIGNEDYPEYAVCTSGSLIVEDGTEITSDRGAIKLNNGANVTINGGKIRVTDALGTRLLTAHVIYAYGNQSKLTINNGDFAMDYVAPLNAGASVICPAGATIKVYNGNFNYAGPQGGQSGIFQNYMGYGVPVNVYGGIYNDKTVSKNLAPGYKVVESNGKYIVVVNEGEIVSNQEEFKNLTINSNAVIYLNAGEYVIPSSAKGKTVKFVGMGNPEDVKIAVTKVGSGGENCDFGLDGSNATFENLTITTNNSTYIGYARCNGTYKNCIINGMYTLYGKSNFEDCTLNVTGDVYNIWTWGAKEATFTRCTFNCDGKAVLVYNQNLNITFNTCTFNDNGSISGKAAIETSVDNGNTKYTINVNNCTINGFDTTSQKNPTYGGTSLGSNVWGNKNLITAENLDVIINGVEVY